MAGAMNKKPCSVCKTGEVMRHNSGGNTRCKKCHREYMREYMARKRSGRATVNRVEEFSLDESLSARFLRMKF